MLSRACAARQAGVSLVEAVVAMAVLSIALAAAMPSLSGWIARARLQGAAESVHAGIQLARTEAIARNARVRFTLQANSSWSVACVSVGPGCPDTADLHVHDGRHGAAGLALRVDGTVPDSSRALVFTGQGRPDRSQAGRIGAVELWAPVLSGQADPYGALRVAVSEFGHSRRCYPRAPDASPMRC